MTELNGIVLHWTVLNWIALNKTKPEWIVLNWNLLVWIALNSIIPNWITCITLLFVHALHVISVRKLWALTSWYWPCMYKWPRNWDQSQPPQ
jgi:hypothetical protein